MKKVVHRSDTRGRSVYDWLDSHHSFSFDEYYNPERVHFGALRVLNDDRVAPGEGFQTHPHKNMEIVSIPLKGLLAHGDSKKNSRTITVGDIQVMSAGTGIYHSEMNGSKSEPVEFLQIWIIPKERNTHPLYQDYDIRGLLKKDELAFILSPDGSTPAKLLQDTCRQKGVTVVVITHNSAITPMADRVIHIKNGTVESMQCNEHPTSVELIEW